MFRLAAFLSLGALLIVAALFTVDIVGARQGASMREALNEGRITIYSATDEPEFRELLRTFSQAHPGIRLDYRSMTAVDVYRRFREEADRGDVHADLLINSASDLQVKLVNDGYAQTYLSPETPHLPRWAVWKDQAFAVTAEPIVIAYNRKNLSAALVPQTHDDFARILYQQQEMLRGRVGSYDPAKSPVGLLYFNQDLQVDRDGWDLIAALGRLEPKLYRSSREMLEAVSSGELLIAYNVIGPYAFETARRDDSVGVVMPQDYTLVMSRVAVIPAKAPHPAAARLFLDFMLSRKGQQVLSKSYMIPLRNDISPKGVQLPTNARAVQIGPGLLANLDAMNQQRFLEKWRSMIAPDPFREPSEQIPLKKGS